VVGFRKGLIHLVPLVISPLVKRLRNRWFKPIIASRQFTVQR
jgi:hypothetical protein